MKMREYPSVNDVQNGDILIINRENIGTRKMSVEDFVQIVKNAADADLASAVGNRRLLYRGKNLGSSVTQAQAEAISSRSFDDLYLGDYWEINGVRYRIADFNYWALTGDTNFTKSHLVIVPDTLLYNEVMNDTNITTGAYVGSKMRASGLTQAKNTIRSAFGSLLLTHREYLQNAVTNGRPSGGLWIDSEVDLMNEIMLYGCSVYGASNDGVNIPNIYTINNSQLALFQARPDFIKTRQDYWLRDVVSAAYFALVAGNGDATYFAASFSNGVRPVFAIG